MPKNRPAYLISRQWIIHRHSFPTGLSSKAKKTVDLIPKILVLRLHLSQTQIMSFVRPCHLSRHCRESRGIVLWMSIAIDFIAELWLHLAWSSMYSKNSDTLLQEILRLSYRTRMPATNINSWMIQSRSQYSRGQKGLMASKPGIILYIWCHAYWIGGLSDISRKAGSLVIRLTKPENNYLRFTVEFDPSDWPDDSSPSNLAVYTHSVDP